MKEIEAIKELISSDKVQEIVSERGKLENWTEEGMKYNVFRMISDTFYRENYHSDILKALLEVPQILEEFIGLLNKKNEGLSLSFSDFKNAKVVREEGRIDILISDTLSKKAILIESKMNGAVDQYRQLPNYVEKVKKKGCSLEAIVYLSLDGHKRPDRTDWSQEESVFIDQFLVIMGAYTGNGKDVFSTLAACESFINDIDLLLVIRQYKRLLQSQSIEAMHQPVNDQFLDLARKPETYKDLKSLKELFDNLPAIQAEYIREIYSEKEKYKPFQRVAIHNKTTVYFDKFDVKGGGEEMSFTIDIVCQSDSLSIQLFDKGYSGYDPKHALWLAEECQLEGFAQNQEKNQWRIYKDFKFPEQEKEMYAFLDEVLGKIKTFQTKLEKVPQDI